LKTLLIASSDNSLKTALKNVISDDFDIVECVGPVAQGSCSVLILGDDLKGDFHRGLFEQYVDTGIPILLTWKNSQKDLRSESIDIGCTDYIAPPFCGKVINAKLKNYVELSQLRQFENGNSNCVSKRLCDHECEMLVVQDAAIFSLATVARIRDYSTGNHILRTQHYVKKLAEYLKDHPTYKEELDSVSIELLYKTAALHDIGKVGVPDSILQKPGLLTDREYEVMKQHTLMGYQAIHSAELMIERDIVGRSARFLKIAKQVTLSHHERWDGNGYPQGLKAEDIPIVARIMALADVYDAVISRRPYKGEIAHQKAVEMICEARGTHFDPVVVDAFVALEKDFEEIGERLEDHFPAEAEMSFQTLTEMLELMAI